LLLPQPARTTSSAESRASQATVERSTRGMDFPPSDDCGQRAAMRRPHTFLRAPFVSVGEPLRKRRSGTGGYSSSSST